MALAAYRRKRDFRRTPEPAGKPATTGGWLYVVQKHAASHLHYDFRLQLGDRLLSWAVPKGPSLDPSVKRLAMHVEDHPVAYGSFEGIIPQGEYGGGTVMLWDRGTWTPEGDAEQGYRDGKLHFTLHGEKLKGEWVLVRPSPRGGAPVEKQAWLLFKVRDKYARAGGSDILEQKPLSVLSGRDMEKIAASPQRVWKSKPATAPAAKKKASTAKSAAAKSTTKARRKPKAKLKLDLADAPPGAMPRKVTPQLATLVKDAPTGDQWLSEIKFDGYRMIARLQDHQIKFYSRNQLDWTARLPHLVEALEKLGLRQAVLDGEVVALEANGASSFQALQNAFREKRSDQLVYYLFDVLHLDGKNVGKLPLLKRKQLLEQIVGGQSGPLRYSEHVVGGAPALFREACKLRLEGIICKRSDRPYHPGRSADWLKVKCGHREEFVIGGFTPPAGSRQGFGALLLGYHDAQGKLIYAGRVGTGFSDDLLVELSARLKGGEQKDSPFANLRGKTGVARGVHWVKPRLVAQVEFGEWTRDGHLRHPAFLGLRQDKVAQEVTLERPAPLSAVEPLVARTKTTTKTKTKTAAAPLNTQDTIAKLPPGTRLTHPDKVLYPDIGLTKADLAAYYAQIADWILPQLADRPLVLVRCPDGQAGESFYQKHAGVGTPDALRRIPIVEKRKTFDYVAVDDLPGLLSLVQISTLEIHVWGSRADKLEMPDRLVFDLDPDSSVSWSRVVESAQQLRSFFESLDLTSFVKTTGGKGLHVVLPIDRRLDWDAAKEFCRSVADAVVQADPERYTANMSKAARPGKIFIDYLRNARGATSVAAYSTRARPGAPVSTPVSWRELPKLESPNHFNVQNIVARLARLKTDPWHDLAGTRQSITKSLIKKLQG